MLPFSCCAPGRGLGRRDADMKKPGASAGRAGGVTVGLSAECDARRVLRLRQFFQFAGVCFSARLVIVERVQSFRGVEQPKQGGPQCVAFSAQRLDQLNRVAEAGA